MKDETAYLKGLGRGIRDVVAKESRFRDTRAVDMAMDGATDFRKRVLGAMSDRYPGRESVRDYCEAHGLDEMIVGLAFTDANPISHMAVYQEAARNLGLGSDNGKR